METKSPRLFVKSEIEINWLKQLGNHDNITRSLVDFCLLHRICMVKDGYRFKVFGTISLARLVGQVIPHVAYNILDLRHCTVCEAIST